MQRLPRQIGRNCFLGSDDIDSDLAQAYGYMNRSLDVDLDTFVDALATRICLVRQVGEE